MNDSLQSRSEHSEDHTKTQISEHTEVHTKTQTSEHTKASNTKFWSKMLYVLLLTLPMLTLHALGTSNLSMVSDQVVYVKYGGVLMNNKSAPNDTSNCAVAASLNKTNEDHAQSQATDFQQYSRMGRCAASMVFVPVWGAFSDRHGRHTAIIVGSAGALVYFLSLLLVEVLDAAPLWILIMGDVLHGVLGSSSKTILAGCAAYAADVFQAGDRTLILITFDGIFLLAYTMGQVGGGYWIQASGFVPITICVLALHATVIIYGIIFSSRFTKPTTTTAATTDGNNKASLLGILNYFTQTYKTVVKPRGGFDRVSLLLVLLLVVLMHFSIYGVTAVFNIYTLGPPLCWSSVLLGVYNGVGAAVNALCGLALGLLFVRCSIRAPAWLVLIGLLSNLINVLILGFVMTDILMYVALVVGACTLISTASARAIISDLVDPQEQGAALSGYFVCSVFAELLSSPLFNAIFVSTISFYNRTFFFAAALFDIVSLLLLGVYGCIRLKDKGEQYKVLLSTQVTEE